MIFILFQGTPSQGFLMVKFKLSATTESERRSTKGMVYPPVDFKIEVQAVAIKEAHIRLKFIIPRLDAKCLGP